MWSNPENAQKLVSERNVLVNALDNVMALENQITDAYDMIELAEMENDADLISEAEQAFSALQEIVSEAELESLLNGEADKTIHS